MKNNKYKYKVNVVSCTVCGRQYNGRNIIQHDDTNTTTINVEMICKECFIKLLGSEFDKVFGYV